MHLKSKEIEIKSENIFANDKLQRENAIVNLSNLITKSKDSFVLSINADWGAGKTTFVKMWKEYLKKEMQVESIYFSAWENDFLNDPFISILGEVNEYIDKNCDKQPNVSEEFKKLKSFAIKMVKKSIPNVVQFATSGIVNAEIAKEAFKEVYKNNAEELINNYSKEKSIVKEFKVNFKTVIESIYKEKENKIFVIFIDELDRCRPLYAIELLERVKHVFGIENLVFVLSIDKKQLSESIKSQYGNIDTDNYLRRFFDLEYRLENSNIDNFCSALYDRFDFNNILEKQGADHNRYLETIQFMVKTFNLSLRQVEQIFVRLNILTKTSLLKICNITFETVLFFEILRSIDSEKYYKFIKGEDISQKIREMILLPIQKNNEIKYFDILVMFIIYCVNMDKKQYEQLIEAKMSELRNVGNNEELDWQVKLLNGDITRGIYFKDLINIVIKDIEFLNEFNFKS